MNWITRIKLVKFFLLLTAFPFTSHEFQDSKKFLRKSNFLAMSTFRKLHALNQVFESTFRRF